MTDGEFFPTRIFEEDTDVFDVCQEYNEATFWDEIVEKLAERDFFTKYSAQDREKMTKDERVDKLYVFIDKWAEEINENGLDNLAIVKKSANG